MRRPDGTAPVYFRRRQISIGRSGLGPLRIGRLRLPAPRRVMRTQQGGSSMTKADLVEEISVETGVSKNHTAIIVDGMIDAVCRALSEGKHLEIRGFGTFKVRERRARRARNPRSGTEVMVPAKLVPVFKPSKELRGQIAGPVETPEPVTT